MSTSYFGCYGPDVALLAPLLMAATLASSSQGRYVIEPGREAEIAGMFAPHTLGAEVTERWMWTGLTIRQDTIVVSVAKAGGQASITLAHFASANAGQVIGPFAVSVDTANPATAALLAALRKNAPAKFWHSIAGTKGQNRPAHVARQRAREQPEVPWTERGPSARNPNAPVWGIVALVLFAGLLFGAVRGLLLLARRRWPEPSEP